MNLFRSSCDFFTAFIYIPVGFVYYHTIGTIQNVCIRKANKKLQKKAAKSWTPTSYKAFAVDAVIVTSVLALGILGTKYFCSLAKSSINQKPNDNSLTYGADAVRQADAAFKPLGQRAGSFQHNGHVKVSGQRNLLTDGKRCLSSVHHWLDYVLLNQRLSRNPNELLKHYYCQ